MKDKRKIVLGTKDVYPRVNDDLYINLEIYNYPDELQTEIINNDFNLREQFNKERRESLKFCIYGTLNSLYSDLDNIELNLKTNHEDLVYVPRIESGAKAAIENVVVTKALSYGSGLSKNIFKKNKSSFYFMFELSPGIKNFGETKSLIITINDSVKKIYSILEVPFLFFDSDKNLIDFGTDNVDLDLNGNEQVIENDFPFLYDTHWIKREFTTPRPLNILFGRSENNMLNNLTVKESVGTVNFVVALDFPSLYGIEEAEVFIKENTSIENPNKDFNFEPKKISWDKGEQYKNISIDILDDLFTEDDERLIFGVRDVKFAEQIEKSNFELIIENDDIPSPVGFESPTLEIKSDEEVIKTYLTTTKAIKVPNQSVDLVLDSEKSDVVIGEDIENTGTPENPEYRKTIQLRQGLDIFELEININDNFNYDFDKSAIFKLENPTQNVTLPENSSELDVTIKDSMITRYTNYRLDSNPQKGQGIFRLSPPAPESPSKIVSFIKTVSGPTSLTQHIVTTNFQFTFNVINDGEPIIFEDKMILSGESVTSIKFKNGYTPINVKLPSNTNIDKKNMYFEKSKYKFVISDISPSSVFPLDPQNLLNSYSDVTIKPQELESSIDKSGKTHYLTSELIRVRTRMKVLSGTQSTLLEVYNLIISENISVGDSISEIDSKLRLSGKFPGQSGGIFGIGSGSEYDESKINYFKFKISEFLDKNPELKPPKPYFSTNDVQNDVIKCKINGTLLLNKVLTENVEIPETTDNNGVISSVVSVLFGGSAENNNSGTEPGTDVLNVKFEPQPVVYSQSEEADKLNLILPPVEPFL